MLALSCAAVAGVSFASVFVGDSVVLQAGGKGARVWGSAAAGASVSLSLDGVPSGDAVADATGRWEALLPSRAASWARATVVATTSAGASASAVARFGFVLLCSGQSNMQMPLEGVNGTGFGSFNGTEEMEAAGALTGKISIMSLETPFPKPTAWNGTTCPGWPPAPVPGCAPAPQWNALTPGVGGTVRGFSAVCYYAGKQLLAATGAPVGLIAGSVGGSSIALWLPPGVAGKNGVPADDPPCDNVNGLRDSMFYSALIAPFAPYSLGGILYDQAERDVHCFAPATNKIAEYSAWQRALSESWRAAFKSPAAAFVAIQLHGYIGDCDSRSPAQPNATYADCVPGVFLMRLAQDAGARATPGAALTVAVPTYDLSCPFGVNSPQCPWGSVHNVVKAPIGARAARALLGGARPPRAVSAVDGPTGQGYFQVTVSFEGGALPLTLSPTAHCAACCAGGVGDFSASNDGGQTWVNGTVPDEVIPPGNAVVFVVKLNGRPTLARYTANQGFPQCAVVGADGTPAAPFEIAVTSQ